MNEIVIPNETGFLVPVDDPESLAKKIILVLKNPDQQKYMGHQARKLVDGTLIVHQMARAFEQLMLLSKPG
jgi:glycosyltransferase involved in cell wall biosynthesis